MTDHNNASETSGETEIQKWRVYEDIVHGWWGIEIDGDIDADPVLYPKKMNREYLDNIVASYNAQAETIKRLRAERDAAANSEFATKVNSASSVKAERQRAEAAEKELERVRSIAGASRIYLYDKMVAAEKRIAELEADLQRARAALEEARADRLRQIDYACDLQRIIEDLCHGRDIREPKTSAVYHYNMAVAYNERKS